MPPTASPWSFKAVFFDMDGTLVFHPEQNLHYQSWVEVLKKHAQSFSMQTFNDHFFGRANEQIFSFIQKELKLNPHQLSLEKEQHSRDVMVPNHLEFVPGCEVFLEQLKAQGIVTGIITSAPYKNLEATWKHLKLERFFKPELIITEEDVIETKTYKPHAAPFLELIRRVNIPKAQTLFVGDSNADIAGAKNAGIFSIGIATNHSVEELLGLGANLAYRHYEEIDLSLVSKSLSAFSSVSKRN